jgi:CheY-like chemotaxis protein
MLLLSAVFEALPKAAGRPWTILVVDDEPDIRDAVRSLLERGVKGARVLVAASGDDGLSILKAEPVDLIVTDYKMPGMNGIEFLAAAREVAPEAPRILITAFERELAEEMGSPLGVEYVFTKPLEPRSLIKTCQRILAE